MRSEPVSSSTAPAPQPAPSPDVAIRPARRTHLVLLLIGIELGQLLTALDQTVVGTAAPRILADLNGFSQYTWVATAYLLASTVTMPIYGKVSDLYGRRPFFLGGMLVFLFGSALTGLSHNMTQLILFRALQGIGGGAIMPIVSSIIGDLFPPAERGKWQGMTVSVWGIASILGPLVGGWITDHWGWRWVFYVNMPIGILALGLTAFTLERQRVHRQHTVDYLGALALTAATVPLLLAFSWAGTQYAWTSPIIVGLLIFAVGMIGVFLLIERRAAEAIIAPALFANRIFSVSIVTTFVVGAALLGSLYFLPLFVQAVIGQTATNAGVALMPIMFGVITSSVIGGLIMARTGRYKVLALVGLTIAMGGMFLLSELDVSASETTVARDMFIVGLGIGISMTLFTIIVQNAFPSERIGQVTGALNFFREIGGTIGLAVLGSIMTSRFHEQFLLRLSPALRQQVPPTQLAQLNNPQLLLSPDAVTRVRQGFAPFGPAGLDLFQHLMIAIRASLAEAITRGFLAGTLLIAVGFVATLFLREIPLRKKPRAESSEASSA